MGPFGGVHHNRMRGVLVESLEGVSPSPAAMLFACSVLPGCCEVRRGAVGGLRPSVRSLPRRCDGLWCSGRDSAVTDHVH